MNNFTRMLISTTILVLVTISVYSQIVFKVADVGIGTVSPTQKLDVVGNVQFTGALMPGSAAGTAGNILLSAGAGVAPTWLANGDSGSVLTINASGVPTWVTPSGGAAGWALVGNSGTTAGINFIGTTDAKDFVIKTNGTERMRITSAGNIGINTTTPNDSSYLDIAGGAANNGTNPFTDVAPGPADIALQFSNGGGYRHFIASRHDNGATAGGNAIDFYINSGVGGANGSSAPGVGNIGAFTIENYGGHPRVGVGTIEFGTTLLTGPITDNSSVNGMLEVHAPTGSSDITISTADAVSANVGGFLEFRGTGRGGSGGNERLGQIENVYINASATDRSSRMTFYTNNGSTYTEAMTITSSQNIGIGTAVNSAAQKLEIGGSANTIRIDGLVAGATFNPATSAATSASNLVYVNNATGDINALANGTKGQVLTLDATSGVPTWEAPSGGGGSGWALTGNSGVTYASNFIGTSSGTDQGLKFEINGVVAGRVEDASTGNGSYLNTSYGYQTLANNTTSRENVAIGYQALMSNVSSTTSGSNPAGNVAIGSGALSSNNSTTPGQAQDNTAVGWRAGYRSTTGYQNVDIGVQTNINNLGGDDNVAVGFNALSVNSPQGTYNYNTAVGSNALIYNAANSNTAVGYYSLSNNTSGTGVTAVGYKALAANQTGIQSTAFGYAALAANTAGNNIAFGWEALTANITGGDNIAIGPLALGSNTSGNENIAIGDQTLNHGTGSDNIAIGLGAADQGTVTGNYNDGLGFRVLTYLSGGSNNEAIGYETLYNTTTGSNNVAVGYKALINNNTRSSNVAIGANALLNSNSSQDVAVGDSALYSNTSGTLNTALGYQANVGANNLANATVIGAKAVAVHSNTLILGDSTTTGSGSAVNVAINTAVPATDAGLGIKGLHFETLSGTTATTILVNPISTGIGGSGTFNATNGANGGTDVGGSVQIITGGSGVSAGQMITVNFATAYKTAPAVVITPTDATTAAADLGVYVMSTTTDFSINFSNVPATSTSYNFNYFVIETK